VRRRMYRFPASRLLLLLFFLRLSHSHVSSSLPVARTLLILTPLLSSIVSSHSHSICRTPFPSFLSFFFFSLEVVSCF
jgi:hypothetical protein